MFNGKIQRMLDLIPTSVHDRCPVILGAPNSGFIFKTKAAAVTTSF
jgi:fructose-1,6-bisphosphatase